MDGTNTYSIVSEAAYKASGITLDIITKRVYWCDSLLDYIETVNYKGEHRFHVLRGQQVPSPSRLALFENRVYWTDGTKQGIMSVDKYASSTSIQSIFKIQGIRDPKAVKTVHGLSQVRNEFLSSLILFTPCYEGYFFNFACNPIESIFVENTLKNNKPS